MIGARTASEIRKLRIREITRKRRMRAFRCLVCQFWLCFSEFVYILRLLAVRVGGRRAFQSHLGRGDSRSEKRNVTV